jgi:hypothetical protein
MRPPSYADVRDHLLGKGYRVFDRRPFDLTLFGIRSPERRAGAWDDRIGALFNTPNGQRWCLSWEGTTDPGLTWLHQPMVEGGTAVMLTGQHRGVWKLGKHRGVYPALVQASAAPFVRDPDRDSEVDINPLAAEKGVIGLNLHRADDDDAAASVGPWSAGCQVVRLPWDFAQLMWLVGQQKAHGNGDRFSYALVDDWRA